MKLGFGVVLAAALTVVASPASAEYQLKGKEGLACEALVCSVGIAIPASAEKCAEVLTDWSIYLATLGPWSDPPKCPSVDEEGNKVGEATVECAAIESDEFRTMCDEASAPPPTDPVDPVEPTEPVSEDQA